MIVFDTPYGLGVADWDKVPTPPSDLKLIFEQLQAVNSSPSCTAVVWGHWTQLPGYLPIFQNSQFCSDIQNVSWYKINQNVEGPQEKWTHAREDFLVGRQKSSDPTLNTCRLSRNPLERHNVIQGPTLSRYRKDLQGNKINIHEKPTYLMKQLCEIYTNPGDWVIVVGAGAGGEVFGAVEADCNVLAIERDKVQCELLQGNAATWDSTRAAEKAAAERKQSAAEDKALTEEVWGDRAVACDNCGSSSKEPSTLTCSQCDVPICPACAVSVPGIDRATQASVTAHFCGEKCQSEAFTESASIEQQTAECDEHEAAEQEIAGEATSSSDAPEVA